MVGVLVCAMGIFVGALVVGEPMANDGVFVGALVIGEATGLLVGTFVFTLVSLHEPQLQIGYMLGFLTHCCRQPNNPSIVIKVPRLKCDVVHGTNCSICLHRFLVCVFVGTLVIGESMDKLGVFVGTLVVGEATGIFVGAFVL